MAGLLVYQVHEWKGEEILQSAQELADELDGELQRRLHGLEALKSLTQTTDEVIGLKDWYRHVQAYDKTFDAPVLLVDEQRTVLLSSRRPLGAPIGELPKPGGLAVFEEALASGEPRIGSIVFGPFIQRNVVPLIVPISGMRAVVGVVVPEKFQHLVHKYSLRPGWNAAIFDAAGSTLVKSNTGIDLQPGDPPSARRAGAKTKMGQWSVVVEVAGATFYRTHVEIALALLASVWLIFWGTTIASWRASQGLMASVERLAPGRLPMNPSVRAEVN